MHDGNGHERVTKTFPVFDCDAHINDPDDDLDATTSSPPTASSCGRRYWKDDRQADPERPQRRPSAAAHTTSPATTRSASPGRR